MPFDAADADVPADVPVDDPVDDPVDVPVDVVVLGAGPAGLAAAWYASRRGFAVTVVDHADHVGGLAGSTVIDGQAVDFGSHRLHPSIRVDLLHDLRSLGVDLQWRPRRGRIRLHGCWLAFPLAPVDLVRHAPPGFAVRVAADAAIAPLRRWRRRSEAEPDSFEEAVRRGLGATVYEEFYGPYARKLWGVDGAELSAELFRRRVSRGSFGKLIRTMLRPGTRTGFWYPTSGFGTICDSLAAGIAGLGGRVLLGAEVDRIVDDGAHVRLTLGDGRSVLARTVVSTIPPRALLRSLDGPASVLEAADRLESRAAVLVYLTVPRDRYSEFDAHYFPEPTTIVSRVSEPKAYRRSSLDPANSTVLCVEVPVTVGDSIWSENDETLAARVSAELVELGLPDPKATAAHVLRRTHVYPVYRAGFESDQRIVERHLDSLSNVTVVGRQATFAHDNTHHALLVGKAVADALDDDGRIDTELWAGIRAAFADHVVED